MRLRHLLLLSTAPAIGLAGAVSAQEATAVDNHTFLGTITLIFGGKENIESTGGAVVTEDDIAAIAPADVAELFARESAVTVAGGAGTAKRIHIFGMEQSNLAVTVDGVPQARTSWHHTGSGVIDPYFLKRVEVEAGAAAADAGFGAGAGAVRYETVSAADLLAEGDTMGGRAALSWGSNGRGGSASLAGFGKANGFDWLFMVHGADGDDYEAGNGLKMDGTAPAARGVVTKLGYEFEDHRIELAHEYSRDYADRTIKMNMDLYGTGIDRGVYPMKVTNNTLSLKYSSTAPTATWDPEVLIYTSRNGYWRPNYVPGRTNGDMILDTDSFGGTVKNTFTLGAGSVTAGIDFANDDYSIDNYGDTNKRYWNLSTLQYGAFVQGRFAFENGIDLSAGARLDHFTFDTWDGKRYSDSGASVNGTLSYEFTEGFEVFAGASRTWLGYEIGEYGLLHARTAAFTVDPAYQPATATNAKIGLNASGDNWNAGITFFDTRLKNLALYDTGADFRIENAPEARSKGYTLNAAYQYANGRLGFSYTRADVTSNGVLATPDGSTVMPIGDTASVYVDHQIPDWNMKVGATVEWAGKLSDPLMTAAGFRDHVSYTVVNAYAEWVPPAYDQLTVRLGVDNLFDEAYYDRSSYVQRVSGSRTIDPLYAPGRTVTLGVSMNF